MKKNYWLIIVCLLCSLFIYLFYRTEKTVVNQIFISIVSLGKFVEWRRFVAGALPLNSHIIYSLPEGLWVFCITLVSKPFYVKVYNREINLLFLPLIFSIGLELLQLVHITNGRFDFWDIGSSVAGWSAAAYLMKNKSAIQNIRNPFTNKSLICVFTYLIVYLAHVWK